MKPEIKTVKDSDWKEDRASYQEAPEALSEASKDVREPSSSTQKSDDLSHYFCSS